MIQQHTQDNHYIGIDVSKAYLDIYMPHSQQSLRLSNDKAGLDLLHQQLPHTVKGIVLEATGGLESYALNYLTQRGHPTSIVNARNVRRLAQGLGKLAKTDQIDAKILSDYGYIAKPMPSQPKTDHQQILSDLMNRRRQLTGMLVQDKNRLGSAKTSEMKADIQSMLDELNRRIKALNEKILMHIKKDECLLRKLDLLKSIVGVGETSAAQLLSELPELGSIDDKKLAALVGVAPFNRDSGSLKGKRSIWGGRVSVRNTLFMVTLVAVRHNARIKCYYEKLCDKGKPKKVAMIACMRKLLIIMNHMVRNNRAWADDPMLDS